MTEHTPGPWHAEPDGDIHWTVRSEDYGTIVNRHCYPDENCDPCAEGDARLIAAAPELLDACREFIRFADLPNVVPRGDYIRYQVSAYGAAKEAIAKAEGRSGSRGE
jgi:hypothetical protein